MTTLGLNRASVRAEMLPTLRQPQQSRGDNSREDVGFEDVLSSHEELTRLRHAYAALEIELWSTQIARDKFAAQVREQTAQNIESRHEVGRLQSHNAELAALLASAQNSTTRRSEGPTADDNHVEKAIRERAHKGYLKAATTFLQPLLTGTLLLLALALILAITYISSLVILGSSPIFSEASQRSIY